MAIAIIDSLLLLFFIDKNDEKEGQSSDVFNEYRGPIYKYNNITSILALLIVLAFSLYVIWKSKNFVLSAVLSLSCFATAMSANSNEYQDFAILNKLFSMKRDTPIKASMLIKTSSLFGGLYYIGYTYIYIRSHLTIETERIQILVILFDVARDLIFSFLAISFIIVVVYFITENPKMCAFTDAVIRRYNSIVNTYHHLSI